MAIAKTFLLFLLIKTCVSQNLDRVFKKINDETGNFSHIAATLAWESSINPGNPELPYRSAIYQKNRIIWQDHVCDRLATLKSRQSLNRSQQRQYYLLCRGPKYTYDETRLTSNIYEELQTIYTKANICVPSEKNISINNLTQVESAIFDYLSNIKQFYDYENGDPISFAAKIAVNRIVPETNMLCLNGEQDFDKIMAFSRNENVLKWTWLVWREKVGPPMKKPYRQLVAVENTAARRNGYPNIGASWRDELEISNLRQFCRQLYDSVKPLYTLLHGVMRFYLRRFYGDIVPERGPIPAHLLGNLWSQNWEPLADLMIPQTIDLDESIKKQNWTVMHMAKRAEDFYQSLGLPAMTDTFWRKSVFTRENNSDTRCHGTAADMFQDGDFRLLYCSDTSKEDFYVLHHELGHIQYYMAYENQPALFRQANTALHETIGDAIMYGVLTPQHLNRLGLINDSLLFTSNIEHSDDTSAENIANIEENKQDISKTQVNQKDDHHNDEKNCQDLHIDDRTEEVLLNYIIKATNVKDSNNIIKKMIVENNERNNDIERFNNKQKLLNDLMDAENTEIITKLKAENVLPLNEINSKIVIDDVRENLPKLFEGKDMTTDNILLLKLALNKIPQIPFSLLIDEYRWKYFEGSLHRRNEEFWDMVKELQGVSPPAVRGEEYFDAGAKFHVPDNTPYVRYFLSSFLQHQLFETLCKAAVFGRRSVESPVPETISLSRCDIYGSKAAGKILKDFMSRGHSQHWREILEATTGEHDITAEALNRYYQPLYRLLEKFVRAHRVPIGW